MRKVDEERKVLRKMLVVPEDIIIIELVWLWFEGGGI